MIALTDGDPKLFNVINYPRAQFNGQLVTLKKIHQDRRCVLSQKNQGCIQNFHDLHILGENFNGTLDQRSSGQRRAGVLFDFN